MSVSILNNAWYAALSTDVIDNKVETAARVGSAIYFMDTKEWKQIGEDGEIIDFPGFPSNIIYPVESNGAIPVNIQDQTSQTVDLYLMDAIATPNITSPISINETTIAIDSNAGIVDGHAICLKEDDKFYQGVVKSSSTNEISLSAPVDTSFTTLATIKVGAWNMAVDGSGTNKVFSISPPPDVKFDIYGITISGLDELKMDGTTFIGIEDGITNGIVLRHSNGRTKNIGFFVNNLGMEEQGFDVKYIDANRKSEYGIVARKNFSVTNGVAIRLDGSVEDRVDVIIRDDLSSQSLIAVVMHGHVVTD